MALATFILACFAAEPLELTTVPAKSADAQAFIALRQEQPTLCVLDGHDLIVCAPQQEAPIHVTLDPGVSVCDVADLDGDGRFEAIAICGERVLRYDASGGGKAPEVLFGAATILQEVAAAPQYHRLTVHYEGQVRLALPTKEQFELRALDGSQVASIPCKPTSAPEESLRWRKKWMPELGPHGALEIEARDARPCFEPILPEGLVFEGEAGWPFCHFQAPCAGKQRQWQGFPLRRESDPAQYACAWHNQLSDSRVAIITSQEARSTPPPEKIENARHYPGWALTPRGVLQDLPDFNGDGYVDLVTARAPLPGRSIEGITHAISGQTWPMELIVYLYAPQQARFEPRAAAAVKFEVPVTWVMEFGLLRHLILRDFDGDGKSDLACATDDRTYSVWLYRDGFAEEPDFSPPLDAPIEEIVLVATLNEAGKSAIVLRTRNAFYLLAARSAANGDGGGA